MHLIRKNELENNYNNLYPKFLLHHFKLKSLFGSFWVTGYFKIIFVNYLTHKSIQLGINCLKIHPGNQYNTIISPAFLFF